MNQLRIRKAQYKTAIGYYLKNDKDTADILYDLCTRFPNHNEIGHVRAKLFVIGRTYATGIERAIRSPKKQGGSMSMLASHLWEKRKELNAVLKPLKSIKEPLNPKNLLTIVKAHGAFVNLIQPILRSSARDNTLNPRSFASKYLHFHCPAVPIYDSYAERSLRRMVPLRDADDLDGASSDADSAYTRYIRRFWELYQAAEAAHLAPTVKHLDAYLLYMGRS